MHTSENTANVKKLSSYTKLSVVMYGKWQWFYRGCNWVLDLTVCVAPPSNKEKPFVNRINANLCCNHVRWARTVSVGSSYTSGSSDTDVIRINKYIFPIRLITVPRFHGPSLICYVHVVLLLQQLQIMTKLIPVQSHWIFETDKWRSWRINDELTEQRLTDSWLVHFHWCPFRYKFSRPQLNARRNHLANQYSFTRRTEDHNTLYKY